MKAYLKKNFTIDNIPVIIWGENSDKVFIFVHGLESNKEDTIVQFFAIEAIKKGYQVLSFDLPGHGDRIKDGIRCNVKVAVKDLETIYNYALNNYQHLSLVAVSFGTYFSLLAYKNYQFDNTLFISPLIDMENMILGMLKKSNITLNRLAKEGEIRTYSETLYYDYYLYVINHQIEKWDNKTHIILSENDNVVERKTIDEFAKKYHIDIEEIQGGEHFLRSENDYKALENWLKKFL